MWNWHNWPTAFWFAWALGALAAEAYVGVVTLPDWVTRRRTILMLLGGCVLTNALTLGQMLDASPDLPAGVRLGGKLVVGFSGPLFAVACFAGLARWSGAEREGRFAGVWVGPAARFGIISYSFYLVHHPLVRMLDALTGLDDSLASVAVRYATYPAVCLAAAAAFYYAVERHFLNPPARESVAAPAEAVPKVESAQRE